MERLADGSALSGVSRLCMGCEQLGGVDWGEVDVDEIQKALLEAVDSGIDFFDTAGIYGLGTSESRLSASLGQRRFDVTIATKGGLVASFDGQNERATVRRDASASSLQHAVAGSLERLDLKQLPLFYIHWPDPDTPLTESLEALSQLKRSGKLLHVGLSNFSLDQLRAAQSIVPISAIQIPGNMLEPPDPELLHYCAQQGISVCVYGALAQGLLTGKYDSSSRFDESDRRHRLPLFMPDALARNQHRLSTLQCYADLMGKTPAQVATRYLLDLPGVSCVVVGVKSRVQLQGCLGGLGWKMTQQHHDALTGTRVK